MVAGLPKSDDNVTFLFNLMSFWGNVTKIKFLSKKENVAMVEYSNPEEAQNALQYCKGAIVSGMPLQVSSSKFPSIQTAPNDTFTRDFTSLRIWRYPQGCQSPQYKNVVCAPSSRLHVAYLHGYSEDAIKELFGHYGTVQAVNFMPDNNTMGFVSMSSIGEACTAICALHNTPNPFDPSQRPLKVSFSKKQ